MRYVKCALVLGLAMAACGGSNEEAKAPTPPPATTVASATTAPTPETTPAKEAPKVSLAELQKKTFDGLVEAQNANDSKKFASFFTDDAVLMMPGAPEMKGKDGVEAAMKEWHTAMPITKFAFTRVWMKNDVVVAEWAAQAKHTGEFMGVKATNKPVGVMGISLVWTDDKGMIKREHRYADVATIMAQIGASKAKARAPLAAIPASESWQAKGTPDEDKAVDVAKAMYAAMEKFGTEKDKKKAEADFVATITDDTVYESNSMPEVMKGKDAAKKGVAMMMTAFPDAKFKADNAWGFGDVAIVEFTMTGTNKGSFMGKPATNKSITTHGVDIVRVKDGKVASTTAYENGAELAMQLGWMKAPGAAADAKTAPAAKGGDAKTPAKGGDAKTPAPKK